MACQVCLRNSNVLWDGLWISQHSSSKSNGFWCNENFSVEDSLAHMLILGLSYRKHSSWIIAMMRESRPLSENATHDSDASLEWWNLNCDSVRYIIGARGVGLNDFEVGPTLHIPLMEAFFFLREDGCLCWSSIAACHFRSISLDSESHPLAQSIKLQLEMLRSSQETSSSTCQRSSGLKTLY